MPAGLDDFFLRSPDSEVIKFWQISYANALTAQRALDDFQGRPIRQIFPDLSAAGLKSAEPLPPRKAIAAANRATMEQFGLSKRQLGYRLRQFKAAAPERQHLAAEALQASNADFETYLAVEAILGREAVMMDPNLDLNDILPAAVKSAAAQLAERKTLEQQIAKLRDENVKLRAERDAAVKRAIKAANPYYR